MTRVAYLFGVSGSGKSCIAKQLQKLVQVIDGDKLRDSAAYRFSPKDKGLWREPSRRDDLFLRCDVASRFREILTEQWPKLCSDGPILADGIDFGHDGWRAAFRKALGLRKITIIAESKFWIDPRAKVVHANRQLRGWKSQKEETEEVVQQHCDAYRKSVIHHWDCRYEDADEATLAIQQFLLPDEHERSGMS